MSNILDINSDDDFSIHSGEYTPRAQQYHGALRRDASPESWEFSDDPDMMDRNDAEIWESSMPLSPIEDYAFDTSQLRRRNRDLSLSPELHTVLSPDIGPRGSASQNTDFLDFRSDHAQISDDESMEVESQRPQQMFPVTGPRFDLRGLASQKADFFDVEWNVVSSSC